MSEATQCQLNPNGYKIAMKLSSEFTAIWNHAKNKMWKHDAKDQSATFSRQPSETDGEARCLLVWGPIHRRTSKDGMEI